MATIKLYQSRTEAPTASASGSLLRADFTGADFGAGVSGGIEKAGETYANLRKRDIAAAQKAEAEREAGLKEQKRLQDRRDRMSMDVNLANHRTQWTEKLGNYNDIETFKRDYEASLEGFVAAQPEAYQPVARARGRGMQATFSRSVLTAQARRASVEQELNTKDIVNNSRLTVGQQPGQYNTVLQDLEIYAANTHPEDELKQRAMLSEMVPPVNNEYIHSRMATATTKEEADQIIEDAAKLPGADSALLLSVRRAKTVRLNELERQQNQLRREAAASIQSVRGRLIATDQTVPPEEMVAARASVLASGDPELIAELNTLEAVQTEANSYKDMTLPALYAQHESNVMALMEDGTIAGEAELANISGKMLEAKRKSFVPDPIGYTEKQAPEVNLASPQIDPDALSDRLSYAVNLATENTIPFKAFSKAEEQYISQQYDTWSPAERVAFGKSIQDAAVLADPENGLDLAYETLAQLDKTAPMLAYSSAMTITYPHAADDAIILERGQRRIASGDAVVAGGFRNAFDDAVNTYISYSMSRLPPGQQARIRDAAFNHYVGSGHETTGDSGAIIVGSNLQNIEKSISAVVAGTDRGSDQFGTRGGLSFMLPPYANQDDFDDLVSSPQAWATMGNGVPIDPKSKRVISGTSFRRYVVPRLTAPNTYQFEFAGTTIMTDGGVPFEMSLGDRFYVPQR